MHGAIGMASKRRRTIERPPIDDVRGATPERLAKAVVEVGGDDRSAVRIVTLRDSPIERAKDRGVINQKQYDAAKKYYHHWYRAGLSAPLYSMDLNRIFASDVGSFSGMAKTEAQAFHRQRYREAVVHIGPISAQVIEQVVCAELPLEDAGYKLGWGSRPQAYAAAVERMKGALDDLAKLWGI